MRKSSPVGRKEYFIVPVCSDDRLLLFKKRRDRMEDAAKILLSRVWIYLNE